MPSRNLGRRDAVEQGKEYSGGPGTATKTVRTWKGPKAAVLAMIEQVSNLKWEVQEDGPFATIRVEVPDLPGSDTTQAVLDNQWELLPGEIEKDLLESDLVGIATMPAQNKRIIRNAIETSAQSLPSFGGTNSEALYAAKVYNLMLAGVRARVQFAPRLRHTQTVSTLYTVRASVTNAGRIITSATLVATEGLPAGFLIALDAPPFNAISTWTDPDLELSYAWLKHYPTLNSTAGGRLQIVQEWAFGLWSTLLYGATV